jgi:hypothetical protein
MPDEPLRAELQRTFAPASLSVEGAELHLSFTGEVPVTALVGWLAEKGRPVSELSMERPTLEDAFLKLTGRRLREV